MMPMMDAGNGQLIVDLLRVSCKGAMGQPLPRTAESFQQSVHQGKGDLFSCSEKVCRGFESMLESYRRISDWIESNNNDRHLNIIARDLSEEVEWLLGSGFAWRAGYDRMVDYGRYFQAMEERLKRLKSLPLVKDDEKRERICRLWDQWFPIWKKDPQSVTLWPLGWQFMEWRVAEFAPSQPRRIKVSEKRIEKLMDELFS